MINRILVILVLLLVFFSFSFSLGVKYAEKDIITETIYDTIIVEKPIAVHDTIVATRVVKVPVYMDADTIYKDRVVNITDSVKVAVEVERREFRDSNYYAIVSGAKLGDLRPNLDHLEIYTRTEIKSPSNQKKTAFFANLGVAFNGNAQTLGAGVIIKGRYGFDVRYLHAENKNYGMIGASYYFGMK